MKKNPKWIHLRPKAWGQKRTRTRTRRQTRRKQNDLSDIQPLRPAACSAPTRWLSPQSLICVYHPLWTVFLTSPKPLLTSLPVIFHTWHSLLSPLPQFVTFLVFKQGRTTQISWKLLLRALRKRSRLDHQELKSTQTDADTLLLHPVIKASVGIFANRRPYR